MKIEFIRNWMTYRIGQVIDAPAGVATEHLRRGRARHAEEKSESSKSRKKR